MEALNSTLIAQLQELDSIWNPLEPASSENSFRALLPETEQLSGQNRCYLIQLLSWIARAEALQDKFVESRSTLEKAEALFEENEGIYPASVKIRWLLERGRLHILEKMPSQARSLFAEAWSLAINSGEDYFAVEIAQLMAASEPQKAQLEWILRAIEIAESSLSQKTKKMLGGLYTTWGWKLYDLRQFEKSLEIFQKALRSLKALGNEREAFVAQWSIGKVLRAVGKTEEALAIQKSLLAELGIGGRRDGRLYEELAECLQTLKRSSEAQLYFELAYRELSNDEWTSDNQPLKLKRMKDLGRVK